MESFTVRLRDVEADDLPRVGGKAANLGSLIRAGFTVPDGFVVTTAAYDRFVAHNHLGDIVGRAVLGEEGARRRVRDAFRKGSAPPEIERAIVTAHRRLGQPRVAVRSSATAEDLPGAAFAGQQDTWLNVAAESALVEAVRDCWASLWTDRAIAYRERQAIDQRAIALAVVVQRMVDAEVAGVLFTANPVTGRRRQAVIDASPGLGEAIVSGAVNPDHFIVDTASGSIVERRLGDKKVAVRGAPGGGVERVDPWITGDTSSLSEAQVRELAAFGARVEAHYGAPQDTEWAIDAEGTTWLLQARPITTLYPLPDGAPRSDDELRVYFSFNVAQGVYRPLTPIGTQAFRIAAGAVASLLGRPPPNAYAGPAFLVEAASRLFLDITPALSRSRSRRLLALALRNAEARSAPLLDSLDSDPRLPVAKGRPWSVFRALFSLTLRTGLPFRVIGALVHPQAASTRAERVAAEFRAAGDFGAGDEPSPNARAPERLVAMERVLREGVPRVVRDVAPALAAGLLADSAAALLLRGLATKSERGTALRGLSGNPTTEMNLALWEIARHAMGEPDSGRALTESPERVAADYRAGRLPRELQTRLATFLRLYGHRGVAEIDVGLPRWDEDPTYVLAMIGNYLNLDDPARAPDVQFGRARAEAERMVAELVRRAAERGRLRGSAVRLFLHRARALLGLREMPKFCFVLLFARTRQLLRSVGPELAEEELLAEAEDVFFVDLPEAWAGSRGHDLRPVVRERRAAYRRELRRRRVPRVLLSDGTEPAGERPEGQGVEVAVEGDLAGTPASAGRVTARARVVRDPSDASLDPGEILVAPSTDPGWTPLFLTAGGLVMEMGGPMSHGAVVAREYGLPAVVGVPGATEHIETGQEVTVDGSTGSIALRT
jgi:phosphohistidine swiveling domain-containing protein